MPTSELAALIESDNTSDETIERMAVHGAGRSKQRPDPSPSAREYRKGAFSALFLAQRKSASQSTAGKPCCLKELLASFASWKTVDSSF